MAADSTATLADLLDQTRLALRSTGNKVHVDLAAVLGPQNYGLSGLSNSIYFSYIYSTAYFPCSRLRNGRSNLR